jgi:hypothetical protein
MKQKNPLESIVYESMKLLMNNFDNNADPKYVYVGKKTTKNEENKNEERKTFFMVKF